MNPWDLDNLRFLMNIKQNEFDEWMEQASEDDIDYALELIKCARSELTVQLMDAEEELQECDGMDLSEAQKVLAKFVLH